MENILQSIVKIIIIGCVCITTHTEGTQQFLPPPLPYYQNENFFLPTFGPAYRDPVPVFYRAQNGPPPISYQNVNPFPPQQLFHRNENYNPANFGPNLRFSGPQIFHQKPNIYNPQKNDFVPPQSIYKKPSVVQAVPVESPPPKKPAFYATNIVVKEESHPTFYQDDYKNYHEDDYIDNYSDESPSPQEPCLSATPYRYFQTPKANPTNQKLTLCNPHFQPNFASGIYTVKMPITLLPSRFPPRVEELIERIQNYFSTYTEKETPKPENVTSTVQPITSESVTQPTVMTTTEQFKRNKTAEIEELSLEETNPHPAELPTTTTTVKPVSEVTQKTIVVEVEQPEEFSKMAKPEPEKTAEVIAVTESVTPSTVVIVTIPTTIPEHKIPEVATEKQEMQTPSTDAMVASPSTVVTTSQPTNETLHEVTDTNG